MVIRPLGMFLVSCPTALINSPAVRQVMDARAHWEKGAMGVLYPLGAPVRLMAAVVELDAGLQAGLSAKLKESSPK